MGAYNYDNKKYRNSITITGVFCLLLAFYSIYMLINGNYAFWIVILICLYQINNTFFSISNPKTILIENDEIIFSAYGRSHSYIISEISEFKVKEIEHYKKMYIRINDSSIFKGRYWINCRCFSNGKDLWDYFAYLEYLKEPTQLKFRARIPSKPDFID